jgi:hypothetical protein
MSDLFGGAIQAVQATAKRAIELSGQLVGFGQQRQGVLSGTNALLAGLYQNTNPALAEDFIRRNFQEAQRYATVQPGIFAGQQLQGAAVGLYNFASQNLFGDELVRAQREAQDAIERGRDLQLAAIQDQIDVARDSLTELIGIHDALRLIAAQFGTTVPGANDVLSPGPTVHTSSVSNGVLV